MEESPALALEVRVLMSTTDTRRTASWEQRIRLASTLVVIQSPEGNFTGSLFSWMVQPLFVTPPLPGTLLPSIQVLKFCLSSQSGLTPSMVMIDLLFGQLWIFLDLWIGTISLNKNLGMRQKNQQYNLMGTNKWKALYQRIGTLASTLAS